MPVRFLANDSVLFKLESVSVPSREKATRLRPRQLTIVTSAVLAVPDPVTLASWELRGVQDS